MKDAHSINCVESDVTSAQTKNTVGAARGVALAMTSSQLETPTQLPASAIHCWQGQQDSRIKSSYPGGNCSLPRYFV